MSGKQFRYDGYDVDPASGRLVGRYSLGAWQFTEEISFEIPVGRDAAAPGPTAAALDEAARLVYLLAGVSYYKTAAPPVVDLGAVSTTPAERSFLRTFLVEGLGEFAYRNGIDLSGVALTGPERARARPSPWRRPAGRPLVPFGAGIDSIVTVEAVRRTHPDLSLFVVGRGGQRFDAIEQTVQVTGLPVVRAERRIDPAVLGSADAGFLNGHVPVTGILSAIAVMAAVLGGFDAVVMSNEWSASAATLEWDGRAVNHQWSKGLDFEAGLRDVLDGILDPPPRYFSLLRARSELWVARRFAALERYHGVFRSCNKAFYTDPAQRLDRWCGTCDKCCFIDLVLSPFMDARALERIFDGQEPLATPALAPAFQALLGIGAAPRPFECVGDAEECRVAARMAAERADRKDCATLQQLVTEAAFGASGGGDAAVGDGAGAGGGGVRSVLSGGTMFERQGIDFVPPDFDVPSEDEGTVARRAAREPARGQA